MGQSWPYRPVQRSAGQGRQYRGARLACPRLSRDFLPNRGERRVVRMSLQELAALETQQAIESANYENADVTYAVINEAGLLQAGSFQNLQTLVEVSSILAAQGVYTNPEPAPGSEKPESVRQTILGEHPVQQQQQQQQAYHQPPQTGTCDGQLVGSRKSRAAEVRDCHVCGERAGKHSYYGGQVCPSCRAFFRRSVQSGYNATYFCVKDGNCEVTLKTRKNCQYCRYKLCEAAGMKTTWVLTDEERKQKFEGRGKRKSCSSENPGEEGRNGSGEEASTAGRKVILSEEELSTVEGYVRASDYWEQSKVNDMDTGLIRQIIRMVAFRANLDESGQNHLRFLISERTTRFASSLLEFQSLCAKDRDQILGQNMGVVMTLKTCSFFHPRLEWTSQLSPLLGVGEVDKLNVKLRSLNVSGLDRLKLSYKQFFPSPFLQTEQAEIQFTELLTTIGSWPQDEKEYVLVSLVLLFCPDMLDLVERRRVEDCQLKFATLLQKYLTNKHSADQEVARSRFTSGMQLVTKCKELHSIISNNRINLNVL